MAYNLSNLTAANTTLEYVREINTLTDDWAFNLFILGMFTVVFVSFAIKSGETLRPLVAASFVASPLSLILYAIDLVPLYTPVITIVLLAASVLYLYLGGLDQSGT